MGELISPLPPSKGKEENEQKGKGKREKKRARGIIISIGGMITWHLCSTCLSPLIISIPTHFGDYRKHTFWDRILMMMKEEG